MWSCPETQRVRARPRAEQRKSLCLAAAARHLPARSEIHPGFPLLIAHPRAQNFQSLDTEFVETTQSNSASVELRRLRDVPRGTAEGKAVSNRHSKSIRLSVLLDKI